MAIMQRWKGKVAGALGQFRTLQFIAGSALSTYASVRGVITAFQTTVGSSATNTLQTLKSVAVPANTLSANSRGLYVSAYGRLAGNAAPKSVNLNVGGVRLQSGTSTQSGATWAMHCVVQRQALSQQRDLFTGNIGTTFIAPSSTSDTASEVAAITVSVTASDDSAAQSNVLIDGLLIEIF